MSEASDIQRRFSLFEQGLLDEDATNELRQDIYDIASARDLDLFEDERTTSGQIYEMGKGAARGFLSSFATLGEGLGEQADALTNLIGAEDFIDSGEENELVRISREAQESIQERLGADVAYRDQWLTKFGEGVGSFGSFLVPGGALKTLGLGKTALGVTTTQAAGVGAGEQAQRIERAREQGIEVSPEQEDAAILWGSGVGLTELAPVQRILSKISKSADADFKKGIATRLKSALVSGGVEGLQEVTASILQDAVERGVYNESLPFNDSLLDDFTVGGAVGAFADLAVSAAAGRGRDRRNIVAERELREAEQQDIQTVAERVSEGQEQERARMLAAEGTSPEFLRGEVEELTATPDFIVEDDATPDDLLDFQETLDKEMAGVGLSDVKANIFHSLRNVLRNREGNLVYGIRTRRRDDQDVRLFGGQSGIVIEESPETAEGQVAEGLYSNAAGEIFLAADALPKEGTPDQQRDAAVGVLKHEQLHAMRALDLFTDSEWNILTNAVNQKNKKGTSGSYADWARGEYSDLSPIEQTEEAVAEMTRDLRADKTIVTGKPRTLIQRIIDFFPKLNSFLSGRGYTSFDSLVRDIDSGKIGGRKRGEIRTLRALEEAGQAPRVPDFDPSATINQEREEDFPDPERADKLSVRKTDDDDPDRIFPDLPLSARGRGLSQAFLKENGYEEYDPDFMLDGRPDYDHYISNADGSVVAYNYQGKDVSGKAKFSRKTFRNPTLNSLINWMEGGGQRTAAPKVEEKLSFENLYERYASGLLTEEQFNSELVNIDSPELKDRYARRRSSTDRTDKDLYELSQRPSKKLKKYKADSPVRELRKEVAEKRRQRSVNRPRNQLPINYRLQTFQEDRSKQNRSAQIFSDPNASYWSKADADAIKQEINLGQGYGSPQSKIRKANLKALARQLKKEGWKVDHTSKHDNLVSSYYVEKDGVRLRVSDHDLPLTPEREYNRERGLTGNWDDEIVVDSNTSIDDVVSNLSSPTKLATAGADGSVFKTKFSRRKASSAAITPFLEGKEEFPDLPKTRGKILKKDVATYLQERALRNIGGQAKDLNNPDDRDSVADDLAEEAIYEANTQASALEWYNKTIDRMIGMMSLKHPEILTDPDKQTGMLVSLAITSQNLDVPTNLKFAESVYKTFNKTGKFPIVGTGKSLKVMKTNFKKANFLIDDLGSVAALRDFLQTKFKVGELNNALESRLKKFAGTRTVGGENMDTEVYGSAVFGPKVGNGFYTNLRGDFSPVTMDMWFMRTVGRLTGKLLEFHPVKFQKQLDRLAKEEGMEGASEKQLIKIARAKKKQHEKDYKTFRKEFDDGVREKSESVKASESIVKSLTGTIDSPSSGGERNLLRDVVRRAVEKFNRQTGNNIDPASFQALIWYPEQDLYKKLGVSLKHIRQDYASATKSLLLEEGYSERAISEAENRVRVSAESGSRGVRQDSREFNRQGVEETSLDAGRPLSEQEESPTLTDKFSRRVEGDGLQRDRDRRGIREIGSYEALSGAPNVKGATGPIPEIVEIAKSYAERNDIPYRRQPEYVEIDVERSTRIADAYDKMPHDPFNPEVQEAYRDLSEQTIAQYEALVDGGYSFTFFDDNTDPYNGKPWRSLADLRNNKTMAVYSTEAGYGMTEITDQMRLENPLLDPTPYVWKDQNGNDKPVLVNDLFRAVHDAFGHGSEYSGFRARGEENAWLAHSQLFTGPALKALTSETRGQNSWLNFGPYGEHNQTAALEDTVFADQKTGLMPSFTWTEGALPPLERTRADGTTVGGDPDLQKITRNKGAVRKVVEENEKAATTPSVSVPPFSQLADPEAQYVAKNPEEGIKPTPELKDKFSRRSEPEMSPEISKLVDGIAAEPSLPVTPGETYLDVTKSSKLDFYLDKAKQAAINKYARLERYSRDPVFKDNLADTSAIAAAYFADRSMGVTASALKYGVPVYENGITRVKAFYHNGKQYRGLIDVMAPLYQNDYNVSLERLAQAYAIAKRAEDQRARGLKTPVPEGSLKELEAEIAKYKNKDGVPIIEEWYGVWQAYNNKTIEFMKATGIVDDALAQKWIEMSDYVPFYRQGEVEDGEIANIATNAPVMFKKNMTTAIKLKRLAGSESAVNVPMLDAITRNLSMAIDAGMKNVAQQRIVRDMLKIGLATKANRAQRKNASQNFVVNFKVNGVDQYYKIHDPLIYESLQSIEETTGLVTTAFALPSKLLREMVTRDPGFMLANMMRDTLSAYVTSGADFTPVVDTVSNLGKDIEALESFGVVGGYDFMNDPDDMVKAFSKESKKRGINVDGKNAIFNPFKAVWNWAGQGTTLSDAATRKAVYEDVLARTGNEAEAAFQALEVINFSRRGRNPAVRFLTTAIPFLNARFQGLDVLYRGFMGYNPAQRNLTRGQATLTALSRASLITASTLAYWLMFSDSEEYKESTDEQRDLNWIFPNPFGDRPIRIPVPFEVGLLFKTIPERIFDTYDVAKVFGKPGATTDRELFESIVVRGVGSTLEINPLGVQAVGPLFEAVINHNSFTGAPVVPVYVDKNGIEGFLGLESSTEFSKALGLATDINPRKIDHVLYGYGGTIGAYIIDTIDRGIFKNPDIFGKDSAPPTMTVDQYPVVKRFLINKFSSGDRQDFYRLRREIDKVSGTLKDLEEAKRYDELEAVLRSKGHLLAIEKDVDYISKQLTKLRNERQEIERAPLSLISAEEKTEEIERILEEMDYYVRDVPKLKKYANLPATAGIPLSDVVDILSK